jgi:hypothetical protein
MTIFRSELRRCAQYDELCAVSFAPGEPDSIAFSIGTSGEEELVELECLSSGQKRILIYDKVGSRVEVDPASPTFRSWSYGLQKKVAELLIEIAEWEAKLRGLAQTWDIRLLANPELSPEDLTKDDEGSQ